MFYYVDIGYEHCKLLLIVFYLCVLHYITRLLILFLQPLQSIDRLPIWNLQAYYYIAYYGILYV